MKFGVNTLPPTAITERQAALKDLQALLTTLGASK